MKKVTVTHQNKPNVILVCYVDRQKGGRHYAAQFDGSDHTTESVCAWVRKQPNLQLVEKV